MSENKLIILMNINYCCSQREIWNVVWMNPGQSLTQKHSISLWLTKEFHWSTNLGGMSCKEWKSICSAVSTELNKWPVDICLCYSAADFLRGTTGCQKYHLSYNCPERSGCGWRLPKTLKLQCNWKCCMQNSRCNTFMCWIGNQIQYIQYTLLGDLLF